MRSTIFFRLQGCSEIKLYRVKSNIKLHYKIMSFYVILQYADL